MADQTLWSTVMLCCKRKG